MGFHPEFTGRENARMNAALLGLSGPEIRKRLPEIRDFAELGDFFDRPVRTYSSGMALRLAFAVATHANADVLIVDEALAVGDGYFQKKSIDRITEFQKRGGTLLFCSHALYYIALLCDEAIWLKNGAVAAQGPSAGVVREYERSSRRRSGSSWKPRPTALEVGRHERTPARPLHGRRRARRVRVSARGVRRGGDGRRRPRPSRRRTRRWLSTSASARTARTASRRSPSTRAASAWAPLTGRSRVSAPSSLPRASHRSGRVPALRLPRRRDARCISTTSGC